MDLKKSVSEIVSRLESDPALLAKFKKEPVRTLESLTGLDLPDDQLEAAAAAVKARLAGGDIADKLGSLFH
jgi:hypothetical protein